eukprot:4754382-Prymnesium_polylepis.1
MASGWGSTPTVCARRAATAAHTRTARHPSATAARLLLTTTRCTTAGRIFATVSPLSWQAMRLARKNTMHNATGRARKRRCGEAAYCFVGDPPRGHACPAVLHFSGGSKATMLPAALPVLREQAADHRRRSCGDGASLTVVNVHTGSSLTRGAGSKDGAEALPTTCELIAAWLASVIEGPLQLAASVADSVRTVGFS